MEYTILCREKNTGQITKVHAGGSKAEFTMLLDMVLEEWPMDVYDIDVSASMRLTVRESLNPDMHTNETSEDIHNELMEKLAAKIGVRR